MLVAYHQDVVDNYDDLVQVQSISLLNPRSSLIYSAMQHLRQHKYDPSAFEHNDRFSSPYSVLLNQRAPSLSYVLFDCLRILKTFSMPLVCNVLSEGTRYQK